MEPPAIFIIVVTFNGIKWYNQCFSSIIASNIPLKCIVIDNFSSDGSIDYIKKHFPEVTIVENKRNIGFGQASNIGIRYALDHDCDYVFLLNQDAWIEPDTIEKIVNIHRQSPDYGILSPMHLTKDGTHLNIYVDDGARNYELLSDFYCGTVKDLYQVKYVNAAAWLIPRKTLETVGGFDPIFLHYEEDDDYLNRTIFHKFKIGLCPKSIIYHDHSDLPNHLSGGRKRHEQYLLVDQTNLNFPEHIRSYRRYLLRKIFVHILRGQFSKIDDYWRDFIFLCKSKKPILLSRETNGKKQRSWL